MHIIIGRGKISDLLMQALRVRGVVIKRLGIREIQKRTLADFLSECDLTKVECVHYLAYDRTNPLRNILVFGELMEELRDRNFGGDVIFLNSQLCFERRALRLAGRRTTYAPLSTYVFVKRRQSSILASNAGLFRCVELYLPMVIGEEMGWERVFRAIGSAERISLPEGGGNRIATLDALGFCEWLAARAYLQCGQELYLSNKSRKCNEVRKMFVYSNHLPLRDFLLARYSRLGPMVITNDVTQWAYGVSFRNDIMWFLRSSIFGSLIISLFRSLIKRDVGTTVTLDEGDCAPIDGYKAVGPEFYFWTLDMDLEKIEIPLCVVK